MSHKKYPINQSFAGYVRQHLPDIEARLSVGVRYVTVHEEFLKLGFDVTLDTFRGALYRARLARDGVKSRRAGRAVKLKNAQPEVKETSGSVERDYFKRESVFSTKKG
jgi:hypothetical protein